MSLLSQSVTSTVDDTIESSKPTLSQSSKDIKTASLPSLPEFTGFFGSPDQVEIYAADPHITQIEMDKLILEEEKKQQNNNLNNNTYTKTNDNNMFSPDNDLFTISTHDQLEEEKEEEKQMIINRNQHSIQKFDFNNNNMYPKPLQILTSNVQIKHKKRKKIKRKKKKKSKKKTKRKYHKHRRKHKKNKSCMTMIRTTNILSPQMLGSQSVTTDKSMSPIARPPPFFVQRGPSYHHDVDDIDDIHDITDINDLLGPFNEFRAVIDTDIDNDDDLSTYYDQNPFSPEFQQIIDDNSPKKDIINYKPLNNIKNIPDYNPFSPRYSYSSQNTYKYNNPVITRAIDDNCNKRLSFKYRPTPVITRISNTERSKVKIIRHSKHIVNNICHNNIYHNDLI